MGREFSSLEFKVSVETEFSSLEVSEFVLDFDFYGGGVGELIIILVGIFYGDIIDEGVIEAMEIDYNDDVILCSFNV